MDDENEREDNTGRRMREQARREAPASTGLVEDLRIDRDVRRGERNILGIAANAFAAIAFAVASFAMVKWNETSAQLAVMERRIEDNGGRIEAIERERDTISAQLTVVAVSLEGMRVTLSQMDRRIGSMEQRLDEPRRER